MEINKYQHANIVLSIPESLVIFFYSFCILVPYAFNLVTVDNGQISNKRLRCGAC